MTETLSPGILMREFCMTDRQRYREIYWAWKAMKQRTQNPRCQAYRNYGGRGIKVCSEWQSFEPFLSWALTGWRKGLSLDRIDNDGDYCPSNCRWVSMRDNANNRRKTIFLTVNGERKPLTEWADKTGIVRGTIGNWCRKHSPGYAEEKLADALQNGYKPHQYGHDAKPVRCLTTGETFASIEEAASFCGVAPCTLSSRLNHFDGVLRGMRFEFI